jgi:hypothetical protein
VGFCTARSDRRWDCKPLPAPDWIPRFIREISSQVVVGFVRATPLAPPLVFCAHADDVRVASRIAFAEAMFQEKAGLPLLGQAYGTGLPSPFARLRPRVRGKSPARRSPAALS